MRRTVGFGLLDHRRNEDVLKKLQVDPLEKRLAQYKKWLNDISRMEDIRYPKQLLDYRPIGRRRRRRRRRNGRSLKRPLEVYSSEAGTGPSSLP